VCACVDGAVLLLVVAHAVSGILLSATSLLTTADNRKTSGGEATMSSNYKVIYFLHF
jgi:hypothetical protein